METHLDNCQPNSSNTLSRGDTTSVDYRFSRLYEGHNGTVTVGIGIEDFIFRKRTSPHTIVTDSVKRLAVYGGCSYIIGRLAIL